MKLRGKILITGGTGSFGKAVLGKLLDLSFSEIHIFSRDEKKQDDMRKLYNNKKIKFIIGDVRDFNSINYALKNIDFVFHAAALKQVPSCEIYPMEAYLTNVLGARNVIEASINNKVRKAIFLSTDKAVYPINAMGLSKAMMEKLVIAKANSIKNNQTILSITRYGNVMNSRGSVIPLFLEQIQNNHPLTITNPKMTRFLMSLEEAANLVIFALNNSKQGDLFVQKSKSTDILSLANAIKIYLNKPDHKVKIIGTRKGEKLHESLLTTEELSRAENLKKYFRIKSSKFTFIPKNFFEQGNKQLSKISNSKNDYSSNNNLLKTDELIELFNKIGLENYIQK